MDRISVNQSKIQFLLPNTITRTEVCSQTGLVPRGSCPTHWEYFIPGTAPTETCGGWRAHSNYYEEEEEDWNDWNYDWNEEEEETDNGRNNQNNQQEQQEQQENSEQNEGENNGGQEEQSDNDNEGGDYDGGEEYN